MTRKMHAAVVEQFGKPLVLQEWDIPSPGPGQILVKTEACGVCHTDLHAAHGDWPLKPTLPFIPGHEGIGLVVAVGRGRDDREGGRPGRRAVALLGLRSLRVLPVGLGDGLRRGAVRRLYQERRLRRVHPRRPELRRPYPRRPRRQGRRADHLRRHHHLQGHQGDRGEARRMDRHLRRRRPRDIWRSNMPRPWGSRSARSTSTTASSPTPSALAPISWSTPRPAIRPPP